MSDNSITCQEHKRNPKSPLNAVMVSVDYTDLLGVTLPYNRHHFDRVMVVTSHTDLRNVLPVCEANEAICYSTDSFYADGASFNKWRALEEALDMVGGFREDWLCIMDADVLWPKHLRIWEGDNGAIFYAPNITSVTRGVWRQPRGVLVTPFRRMWELFPHNPLPIRYTDKLLPLLGSAVDGKGNPITGLIDHVRFPSEEHWDEFPLHRQEREFAGYSQIFHCSDPVLEKCGDCGCLKSEHTDYHNLDSYCHGPCDSSCGKFAWHQTDWKHAGGADSFFQQKWSEKNKIRPPFNVLHLGPAGVNWCGRASNYLDGTLPVNAEERRREVRQFIHLRGRLFGPNRFNHERIQKPREEK